MKAEGEEAVQGLGFKCTVVLKPGLLVGEREERRGVAKGVGWVSAGRLTEWWAQDAGCVARAAVRAGWECVEGTPGGGGVGGGTGGDGEVGEGGGGSRGGGAGILMVSGGVGVGYRGGDRVCFGNKSLLQLL